MNLSCDYDTITATLQKLVQIDSINPTLNAGAQGEAEIAGFIEQTCRAAGLDVETFEAAPGRPNVIATLRGSGGGPSLMINGHTDTVGVTGMADPFGARISDGRLYGRGSQDMKGSLAAMIGAAQALLASGVSLKGDLHLAFVVDEEARSIGTAELVRHLRTDAAIVTEPTDLRIACAHRGFIWFDVITRGRAAHGSRFEEGIDAIMHMGRFLAELDGLEQALRERPPHALAGPPSLHASLIEGGTEISVYPAECRLQLERRTLPGETVPGATAELQEIIDRLSAAEAAFDGRVEATFDRDAFEIESDAAIVRALDAAVGESLDEEAAHAGATFWTDAGILAAAGIETVLFGPTGAGLHSAEEWVSLQSVFDLADVLAQTAVNYCG